MPVRVTMPPGCTGIDLPDGTRYSGRPGTTITVADRHANALSRSWYAQSGVMNTETARLATKNTSWCLTCQPSRAWQAWTTVCPRCGAPTSKDKPQ